MCLWSGATVSLQIRLTLYSSSHLWLTNFDIPWFKTCVTCCGIGVKGCRWPLYTAVTVSGSSALQTSLPSLEACALHRLVKGLTFHLSQAVDALAAAGVLARDVAVLTEGGGRTAVGPGETLDSSNHIWQVKGELQPAGIWTLSWAKVVLKLTPGVSSSLNAGVLLKKKK